MQPKLLVTCITVSLVISITLVACETNPVTTHVRQPTGNGSDYAKVLELSLLFFEAQRSGKLPPDNRIPWRGDSALNDRGKNGEDLSGGYYDAGDFVKFGFTTAFTTTLLAWGAVSWPEGYKIAGQLNEIRKTIKWATDYFMKCHVSENVLYGQVGDFLIDHTYWGRPEELDTPRPAFKIDVEHPGSDLAGETAAALAASSIVFGNVDPEYSVKCLQHARELYKFADTHRGFYHVAIPGGQEYYESTSYGDELAWASAWLFKATSEAKYLYDAVQHYRDFQLDERPKNFFYNQKTAGVQVLLAQLTALPHYRDMVHAFCNYSIGQQMRTRKGLLYIDKSGTLAYAANIALICLQATEMSPELDESQEYRQFAKQQIDYMIGGSGRSYVVGYGNNPPKQAHHSAASCPDRPAPCGWSDLDKNAPNPQILYGALVSGPDVADQFQDRRDDYIYTDISLDFNAGFTSVLAGLLQSLQSTTTSAASSPLSEENGPSTVLGDA